MDVAAASSSIYLADLVSFGSEHDVLRNRGMVMNYVHTTVDNNSAAGTFGIVCPDNSTVYRRAGDLTVVDRSDLYPGQPVGSASDLGGQIGILTGVTTVLDLVKLDGRGEPAKIIRGVSPSRLERVRRFSLGDYVVSGPWLGRVVEVSIDVDVLFDDGAICKVTDAESTRLALAPDANEKTKSHYRPAMNSRFHPGQHVIGKPRSAVFKASRWLNGYWKPDRYEGTVAKVEMSGVIVYWIASAHCGTDQQLVEASAPPAYQSPHNLTFLCSAVDCRWGVGDRCFFRAPTSTETGDDNGDAASVRDHHQEEQEQHDACSGDRQDTADDDREPPTDPVVPTENKQQQEARLYRKQLRKLFFDAQRRARRRGVRKHAGIEPPMIVADTRTSVDVVWQDGTRQRGTPSTSVVPLYIMSAYEFLLGERVIDKAPPAARVPADDAAVDATGGDHGGSGSTATAINDDDGAGSTRRVGVVRSLDCKDQTAHVSWFKAAARPDEAREVDCDCTVSVYDLERDPDLYTYYGHVVVRLPPSGSTDGGRTPVQPPAEGKKKKNIAAAYLSWVGHVVDLPDGHIQVEWGDGSTSTVLPHEIGILKKQSCIELEGDWVEDDGIDDVPEEPAAANTDNDPRNPTDDSNVEGDGDPADEDGPAATRTSRLGSAVWSLIQMTGEVLARGKGYLANWSSSSSSSSSSELLAAMEHAAAPAPVSGGDDDPSSGAATEAIAAAVTRNDEDVDDVDDFADEGKKAEDATCEGELFCFPRFDVVQSPSDHHYLDNADQRGSGGKSWAKTVQKEWKILKNSLPETIYVRAFEDRMDLLRAVMVGASGTPYHDGLFFFDLQLPPSYPAVPPQVCYRSFGLRLNPNLYESGTVCLSLLNTFDGQGTEVWSPAASSLLQVVVSIQGLVLNDQPYYNEAGYEALVGTPNGRRNALPYGENAYLLTLRTALHLLHRPPRGFEEFVRDHFRRRGRFVLRACKAYMQGCGVGGDTDGGATDGSRERPCSAGLSLALANVVPSLVAAFTEIGAEGCDEFQELRFPLPCALSTTH